LVEAFDLAKEILMKIALPSAGDMVDGHFGHCEAFTIFTVDGANKIVGEEKLAPPPGCGCKSNVIPELAGRGVKVMLAGSMGTGAVNHLLAHGIEVVRGCAGGTREVAESWLAGRVADSGEGCSHHGKDGCGEH
jgi:predicted Fe-Mo cluster-binding NifX family protein